MQTIREDHGMERVRTGDQGRPPRGSDLSNQKREPCDKPGKHSQQREQVQRPWGWAAGSGVRTSRRQAGWGTGLRGSCEGASRYRGTQTDLRGPVQRKADSREERLEEGDHWTVDAAVWGKIPVTRVRMGVVEGTEGDDRPGTRGTRETGGGPGFSWSP